MNDIEPTTLRIDAVAMVLCRRELREKNRSLDEIVAPGRTLWMRYRYEARTLLEDLTDAGIVRPETMGGDSTGRLQTLLSEVIATHERKIGTHSDTCYRYHAGCLALMVRELMEDDK